MTSTPIPEPLAELERLREDIIEKPEIADVLKECLRVIEYAKGLEARNVKLNTYIAQLEPLCKDMAAKDAYIAKLERVLAAVCEESTPAGMAWWHRQLAAALEALVEEGS